MAWYSASLINVVYLKGGVQDSFPVWEDVCLLEAMDDEDAFRKAEILGKERESDDSTLTWNGKSATLSFCGVRKVFVVDNPIDAPEFSGPTSGSEVSFSKFSVSTAGDVDKLVRGESVSVIYEE